MPDSKSVKIKMNEQFFYKCYLLNVRSHKDYVCLEIDNCPSGLNITSNEVSAIDSSYVAMPILDKIRFNIKCTDNSTQWLDKKLEIFAEGKQIYPLLFCSKCDQISTEESISNDNCSLFNSSDNSHPELELVNPCSNTDSDFQLSNSNSSLSSTFKSAVDDCNSSIDNISFKRSINPDNIKSKSEMLSIDGDSSTNSLLSNISLPNILFGKDYYEKSVQTIVSLGSNDLLNYKNEIVTEFHKENLINPCGFEKQNLNSLKRINSNPSKKESNNKNEFYINNFIDSEDKLRYWSLINTSRRIMKINDDTMDLNTLLKSFDVTKRVSNDSNLISSLSPVNVILKLKKLNSSSSLGNLINKPEGTKIGLKDNIKKKWNYLTSSINLTDKYYVNGEIKQQNRSVTDSNIKDSKSNLISNESTDSISNIDNLFSMQEQVLVMMEMFLKKNESNSCLNSNKKENGK